MSQDSFFVNPDQPPLMTYEKYPAEVRKLGTRGMQIFDVLQQGYLDKGFSPAEAYFHAASRTPDTFKSEQRKGKTLSGFEPI